MFPGISNATLLLEELVQGPIDSTEIERMYEALQRLGLIQTPASESALSPFAILQIVLVIKGLVGVWERTRIYAIIDLISSVPPLVFVIIRSLYKSLKVVNGGINQYALPCQSVSKACYHKGAKTDQNLSRLLRIYQSLGCHSLELLEYYQGPTQHTMADVSP